MELVWGEGEAHIRPELQGVTRSHALHRDGHLDPAAAAASWLGWRERGMGDCTNISLANSIFFPTCSTISQQRQLFLDKGNCFTIEAAISCLAAELALRWCCPIQPVVWDIPPGARRERLVESIGSATSH
jgi:hypothetical protein